MATKKKRQRGSRTHGHGSSKNNRGAGHRGGVGKAGRSKHEQHNYDDLGKSGFGRKDELRLESLDVGIRDIDEAISNIELGIDDIENVEGIQVDRSHTDGTQYNVFLHKFSTDSEEYDEVKLLDRGQMRHKFNVFTDTCSKDAKHHVRSVGGNVYFRPDGRGFAKASKIEKMISRRKFKFVNGKNNGDSMEKTSEYREKVQSGNALEFHEFDDLMDVSDSDEVYRIMTEHFNNLDELDGPSVLNLMRARNYAGEFGFDASEFQSRLDSYFEGLEAEETEIELMRVGMKEELTVEDVLSGINTLYENISGEEYQEESVQDDLRRSEERMYLFSVDGGSQAKTLLETS